MLLDTFMYIKSEHAVQMRTSGILDVNLIYALIAFSLHLSQE